MKYRAEIDGLRAIAVIPVILFHAGFELFSGGFVGVDVFFVISGYLITTILIEDIENNRFSILNFYERRARRILPALFFVMLICTIFAWMWMLPSQMKDFSQSLVAVSLFVSNIYFWQESDYFAAAAEETPLLHTWSLAVEEQYYFLFPIFLLLAWRFGKDRVFWLIVLFSVISLALSEWGWRNSPMANFYLPHTRAWELFSGSIAAFIVQKYGVRKNNILSLVGLIAIIFSIFAYDDVTPFPSLYTLVPVVGVVLIVLYGNKHTFVAKLISNKVFVGVGLISYSAYLWHQPLFAFARIKMITEPSYSLMAALSVMSLCLAFFSWRFIEKPFRNRNLFQARMVFTSSATSMLFLVVVGGAGVFISQNLNRDYIYSVEDIESQKELRFIPRQDVCKLKGWDLCDEPEKNKHNVLVIGDSHAADALNTMFYAIDKQLDKVSFSLSSLAGCSPYADTRGRLPQKWPNLKECIEINETQRYNASFLNKFDTIAISVLLGRYTEKDLIEYLSFISDSFTGNVIVFGGTFSFKINLPDYFNKGQQIDNLDEIIAYSPLNNENELDLFADSRNMTFLSKADVFCPNQKCNFVLYDGELLTYDEHHLSVYYTQKLAQYYNPVISKILLSSN